MKNRRLTAAVLSLALCVALLLAGASSAFAQGVVIKGAPDGQNKSTVMDEHFYSGSLEPNFTSDSVSVKTDSYGMHFTGAYHYGSALVLVPYKLKSYNKFTFSIDMLDTNDGFIYCGFGGEDEKTNVSKYDFNLCIASGVTAVYEMAGMDNWKSLGNKPLSNALTVGKTTNFAITLEKASGNDFKLTFEIIEDGKPIVTTDFGTLIHMDHPNGHFCMWSGMKEVFDLRDFKVYDSPTHVAFADSFENSSVTYGDEPAEGSNWHTNESRYTKDEVFISRNAGPEFKKAGDMITAKNKLVTCDKVSRPYEISFNASISSLSKNSVFGIFLAADKPGELDKATVIGVSAYDDKNAAVCVIKNGKKADYGDNLVPLSLLNIDDTSVDFEAVISSNRSVAVTIGGVKFTFSNVKYAGYWGICSYSFDGVSTAVVRLNGVKAEKNTYDACTEPDLSNDFAGIKMTQDGFEEYYISDRTYYMGPGVSLRPKGAFTTEPSLYFENAGSYSGFAPKKPYTDFILQFDLRMVSEGANSQWFGVSFGKSAFASIPDLSTGINFEYYAWGTDPYTQMTANLCTFDDGEKAKKVEGYHFFKDQETKYNFMIVAKNRTVYVYFKEDGEDISKLGICRAVIPNVNTAGYVAVFGVNGLSFDIFNYKLTNIAPEAVEDSAIALRETFDKKDLSDKLAVSGSAQVADGKMKLSGGEIASKQAGRYYIANFTLLESKADMTVTFSDNKTATISSDFNKVTLNDGGRQTNYDISKYNLSENKNTMLQFILQYDALSIGAKGIYDPNDKFAAPVVEHTFSGPVAEGVLKLSSNDSLIDSLSVYYLDNTYKAASVSYEQDPNDVDIWVSKLSGKKSEAVESKGIPTKFIIIYSVIGALILGLLCVIIEMSVKKRGKKQ